MKKTLLFTFSFCIAVTLNAQWEQISDDAFSNAYISDIAVSEDFVWAKTVWNGLWKQDKGTGEWEQITTLPDTFFTLDIKTQGENVFALDVNHLLFVSSDLGQSWTTITPPTIPFLGNFSEIIVDGSSVWVGGNYEMDYGALHETQDTGKTWTSLIVSVGDEVFYPALLARTTNGLFAAESERMFKSLDNGENWEEVFLGAFFEDGCPLCEITHIFSAGDVLFAVETNDYYESNRLHVSKDNGDTWEVVDLGFPGTGFHAGFQHYSAVEDILLTGDNFFESSGIRASFDEGFTSIAFDDGITRSVRKLAYDNEYIYAATGGEGVWRRKLQDLYLADTKAPTTSDMSFNVSPNPSDGNFAIHFLNENETEGNVILTDLSGKIVFEKNIQSNTLIDVDGSILTNGLYVLTFVSDDLVVSSKIAVQK